MYYVKNSISLVDMSFWCALLYVGVLLSSVFLQKLCTEIDQNPFLGIISSDIFFSLLICTSLSEIPVFCYLHLKNTDTSQGSFPVPFLTRRVGQASFPRFMAFGIPFRCYVVLRNILAETFSLLFLSFYLEQDFSPSTLLAFLSQIIFAVRDQPTHGKNFSGILASICQMPVTSQWHLPSPPVMVTKNVAGHRQISPWSQNYSSSTLSFLCLQWLFTVQLRFLLLLVSAWCVALSQKGAFTFF